MKHDKKGLQEKLIPLLNTSYGITAEEIIFIPIGEESISYKVKDKHKTYFVKFIEDKERLPRISVTNQLLNELKHLPYITAPTMTIDNKTEVEMDNGFITVSPFVEGTIIHTPNEEFSKELVEELTKIVIELNSLTNQIKTPLHHEDFNSFFEPTFVSLLELRNKKPHEPFARIMAKNEKKIQELITEHSKNSEYYKQYKPHFVLTHGDITGLNLVETDKGIVLLDWEWSRFAPLERDMMFFTSNPHFDLDYYLQKTNSTYNEAVKKHYSLDWSLVVIVYGLNDLATGRLGEKDIEDRLADIEKYLSFYS